MASKAADKIRAVLQAPLGPNVPSGASRQFVNLVKAIGEAGSNHVRRSSEPRAPFPFPFFQIANYITSLSLPPSKFIVV